MRQSNIFTYVTSFIVGAAAGAVVALLNSPQSGKKTRTQLRRGISDARDRTTKVIARVQTNTMDKIDDIQSRVKEIGDEAAYQSKRLRAASKQFMEKPKTLLARTR